MESNAELNSRTEVFIPLELDPLTADQGDYLEVVARLKTGVTVGQARARVQASAAEYRRRFPDALGPNDGFTLLTFRDSKVGDVRSLLLVLLSAVSLVLLIACANVANLLLVRATGRRRELAIRAAIGAGRGLLIRQMMTESALLSLAGGVLGVCLGYGGIRGLLALGPPDLPLDGVNSTEVVMDWRVLLFAAIVSLVTGLIFGIVPALQASRAGLNEVLKEGGSRSGSSVRQQRARSLLVVGEVGLAVVLLVGSALLIRTFAALYAVDRGYETRNVMVLRAPLTDRKFLKSAALEDTVRAGLGSVRSLPGVVEAATSCRVPLQDGTYDLNFDIVGRPPVPPSSVTVGWATVSPGFFEAFRIHLKRGRVITTGDSGKAAPAVVINERMARRYWKDADPLKDRILIGRGLAEFKDEPVRQVVGIVADVRDEGLDLNRGRFSTFRRRSCRTPPTRYSTNSCRWRG